MLRRKEKLFAQIMLVCDLATLLTSYILAYRGRRLLSHYDYAQLPPLQKDLWMLWIILPTWLVALARAGLYRSRTYESPFTVAKATLEAQIIGALVLLSTMYLAKREDVSRLLLQMFLALSTVLLLTGKLGARGILIGRARRFREKGKWRVLVVGHEVHADTYIRLLREHPYWAIDVIAVVPPTSRYSSSGHTAGNGLASSAVDKGWPAILREYGVDEVVAVSPWEEAPSLLGLADACTDRGLIFRILVKMPSTSAGTYHVEDVGKDSYLVSLETVPQEFVPLVLKRVIDIAGAIVGLILCALVYPWYARRLSKESPGPVLFKQARGGQNGRIFEIYKFRTMSPDAEDRLKDLLDHNSIKGPMFKMVDDPRITPTGHFMRQTHLDELPQFWNVLKGDMSLVGARPNPANEVANYRDHHYRRLSMKPGLTGIFQLNGHAVIDDFEETVKLDCEYIDKWSLWLDCKIIAKTVVKVMRGNGW
jgi:exopolysaccharide biosynthesis polyprenyl glycosylphosphotransferase